jgi:hypothetical protein
MDSRKEGIFAITAAIIVLFSAMVDPTISLGISVAALVLFGIYKIVKK